MMLFNLLILERSSAAHETCWMLLPGKNVLFFVVGRRFCVSRAAIMISHHPLFVSLKGCLVWCPAVTQD